MKTYAIWFEKSDVKKVEDVSDRFHDLLAAHEIDGEQAADLIQEETGASAVVGGHTIQEAISHAADVAGIDALGESFPDCSA